MIVIDGKVYQALGDGTVKEADDNETVPFSNVSFFDSDISVDLKDIKDIRAIFEQHLRDGPRHATAVRNAHQYNISVFQLQK